MKVETVTTYGLPAVLTIIGMVLGWMGRGLKLSADWGAMKTEIVNLRSEFARLGLELAQVRLDLAKSVEMLNQLIGRESKHTYDGRD